MNNEGVVDRIIALPLISLEQFPVTRNIIRNPASSSRLMQIKHAALAVILLLFTVVL